MNKREFNEKKKGIKSDGVQLKPVFNVLFPLPLRIQHQQEGVHEANSVTLHTLKPL